MAAEPTNFPVTRDYPGRLAATLTAQVRARVTGIVLQRVYKEGTDVKAGDVLFNIDPAPLQASLRQAQGQLAQAQATARNANLSATRSKELGAKGVLAKQDVDNAVASAAEADAAVKAAQANVENARINLGYATVTAPISGRAGMANVTQGALVSPTDTNPLTTVQVIDPIYANFSEPMAEVERLRTAEKAGNLELAAPDKVQVQIVLPDGSMYPREGTLDFTDLAVDPSTGAVDLRAIVPNPDHSLLPGMFVKIRLALATLHDAFLLPQSAILRDNNGAYVYVVGTDDKIVEKRVDLGEQRGADWIVQGGIDAGARVVVSGVQKAQAGEQVKPVPFRASADGAPGATAAK
ncbi:MAG: efflux RND transporter periplasmic adaptor subunit [Xanthomonadaceae bacterium]|nr:efflux RND transporter periplasmic adaptor subunit [Xanthomonadaceae bacterium]MBU6478127.1 efflux RND transporter periplasmic adaptor subunit [Xanthomonadaceae bacterium]MDE2053488.1 efflux RND transporter periplasmic adaptor subunit [Xanthomonadaceae bacterium]MDE2223997.1 efflux RND transporter periplasmic adaptor subunit [Xanthomonadaceae bacterium]